ncbi:MAG TPA: ATP-binding protein [Candidatus Ozemobacteraceae bacterium]|mgnify:CR=1 FL=1|nr:ATP-binding protein [Candidatus Ozemobacteraceae bacterium]
MGAARRRSLESSIREDLTRKFVFLSGPRQVGKTTLARTIIESERGKYLNFDDPDDREDILLRRYTGYSLVCLDEFHKYPRWKAHIKGVYDKYSQTLRLILTGSARLDVYQKSGDSLLGRYYLHHLHPLTLGELHRAVMPQLPATEALRQPCSAGQPGFDELMRFGGFPEPFQRQSDTEHRRWSNMRTSLLVQQDLRDLSEVKLLSLAEQLIALLPERVGSLFSARSLSENVQVSTPTITHWMDIFSRLFIVYKLMPYSQGLGRALHRQPKYYFWDWSQVKDEGARFENAVAGHLFKAAQYWTDHGVANVEVQFIRDREGREVDFLMVQNGRPWFLVECKIAETSFTHALAFYSGKLGIPGIQLLQKSGVARNQGNLLLISADRWLGHFP